MLPRYNNRWCQLQGFTIIELMIVVAIIGIIAAVAIPSYQSSIEHTRRSDATETLMRLAIAQETFFAQQGTYTTTISATSGLGNGSTESTLGYYDITATAGAVGTIATGFILKASAKGAQASDDKCKHFFIDSHNKRYAKTSTSTNNKDCW